MPFFNTSYVKSGFHLMTVASLAIAAFGAASNAFLMGSVVSFLMGSVVSFWMGSVVCATTLVETASAPSTNREISLMWVLLSLCLKIWVSKTQGQYTTTART